MNTTWSKSCTWAIAMAIAMGLKLPSALAEEHTFPTHDKTGEMWAYSEKVEITPQGYNSGIILASFEDSAPHSAALIAVVGSAVLQPLIKSGIDWAIQKIKHREESYSTTWEGRLSRFDFYQFSRKEGNVRVNPLKGFLVVRHAGPEGSDAKPAASFSLNLVVDQATGLAYFEITNLTLSATKGRAKTKKSKEVDLLIQIALTMSNIEAKKTPEEPQSKKNNEAPPKEKNTPEEAQTKTNNEAPQKKKNETEKPQPKTSLAEVLNETITIRSVKISTEQNKAVLQRSSMFPLPTVSPEAAEVIWANQTTKTGFGPYTISVSVSEKSNPPAILTQARVGLEASKEQLVKDLVTATLDELGIKNDKPDTKEK